MGEVKCSICDRKFGSEESLNQHSLATHSLVKNKKSMKKYFLMGGLMISLIIFSYTVYVRAQRPGEYNDFAKCLSEKGAVVYGNDFCSYTVRQLNFFGKSKEFLNYVKCYDNQELCDGKNVRTTPTWEIDGKMYEQVQSFEKLASLSGCSL